MHLFIYLLTYLPTYFNYLDCVYFSFHIGSQQVSHFTEVDIKLVSVTFIILDYNDYETSHCSIGACSSKSKQTRVIETIANFLKDFSNCSAHLPKHSVGVPVVTGVLFQPQHEATEFLSCKMKAVKHSEKMY